MSQFDKEKVVSSLDSVLERQLVMQAELSEIRNLASHAKGSMQASNNPESGLAATNSSIAVVKLKAVLEHLKSCNTEIRAAYEEATSAYTAVKAEKEKPSQSK